MKVLYVAPWYEPAWRTGGPARSASALCRGLVASGAAVTVLCSDNNGVQRLSVPSGRPVNLGGVEVRYFRWYGGWHSCWTPGMLPALLALVPQADIVHIDSFWQFQATAAVTICRLLRKPYVVKLSGSLIRGEVDRGNRLAKRVHVMTAGQMILRGAAAVHITSATERAESARYIGDLPSFELPCAVDNSDLVPVEGRAATRAWLGIPETALVVTYSGRLHPRKAVPVLLRAVALTRHELGSSGLHDQDLQVVLAGPDNHGETERLRLLAGELGIADAVHLTGHLDRGRLASVLQASDLIALTSYAGDNFGNACVEGMSMGLPAILSEHVGVAAPAAKAGAALAVPVDEQAIAAALVHLTLNPELRRRMAKEAQAFAQAFSPEAVAHSAICQYKAILSP